MRRALLLAGGSGSRLAPLTDRTSKHLLPVAGRPMVRYALDTLLQAGATDIRIVVNPRDLEAFRTVLGDGEDLGCHLSYTVQPTPGGIAQALLLASGHCEDGVLLALGDNLFLGDGLDAVLEQAWPAHGATCFTRAVPDPRAYGVAELGPDGQVLSLEEKPDHPRSDRAVVGLYGLDARAVAFVRSQRPSARGELEITDLLRTYADRGELRAIDLPATVRWLDMGTHEHLALAEQWISGFESRSPRAAAS